jgi:hypothetical protein
LRGWLHILSMLNIWQEDRSCFPKVLQELRRRPVLSLECISLQRCSQKRWRRVITVSERSLLRSLNKIKHLDLTKMMDASDEATFFGPLYPSMSRISWLISDGPLQKRTRWNEKVLDLSFYPECENWRVLQYESLGECVRQYHYVPNPWTWSHLSWIFFWDRRGG